MQGSYDFPSPEWDEISDDAKNIIRHLLVVDPSQRWTCSYLLQDDWITGKTASTKVIKKIN